MLRCVLVCLLYMSPWFTCLCHLHVIEDRVLLSVIGSAAHDLSRKRKGRTPGALWSRPGGDNTFDSTSLFCSCCSIRVTGFPTHPIPSIWGGRGGLGPHTGVHADGAQTVWCLGPLPVFHSVEEFDVCVVSRPRRVVTLHTFWRTALGRRRFSQRTAVSLLLNWYSVSHLVGLFCII